MKFDSNRFRLIGTLTVVTLLVWLAFMQYKWLGEVSEAQKSQLQETLKAAAANMSADFDRELSEVNAVFQVVSGNSIIEIAKELGYRIDALPEDHPYADWVKKIVIYSMEEDKLVELDTKNESITIRLVEPDEREFWLSKLNVQNVQSNGIQNVSINGKTLNLDSERPYLFYHKSNPRFSFSTSPIQIFRRGGNQTMTRFKLPSPIQSNSMYVVELNPDVIQTRIMDSLATKYLGSSAADLYNWSLVSKNSKPIFSSLSSDIVNKEWVDSSDVIQRIGKLQNQTVLYLQSTSNAKELRAFKERDFSFGFSTESEIIEHSDSDTSSFITHLSTIQNVENFGSNYLLVIRSKSGSLQKFVEETRFKNLSLSFGILGLLGFSLVLIALNSNRLQATAHQQMEFVAGVSHELKTPLAVIRSAAENVADGVVTKEDQLKKYGRLIQSEGQRLSGMVEQILEFSGIQSGTIPVNLQVIPVSEIALDIKNETEQLCEHAGFEFEWYENPRLGNFKVDKSHYKSALLNLITNAIKYSPSEKRIQIRWFPTELKGKSAIGVSVQDFGRGISVKEQKQVFDPFFRGEEVRNEQIRGNGLGLHLVKRWVEAQHGLN